LGPLFAACSRACRQPDRMPLIFAQISNNNGNLCVPLHTVNVSCPNQVVEVVNKKLLPTLDLRKPGKKSHKFEKFLLTTLIDNGYLFLVISEGKEDSDLASSIGFLEETKNEWHIKNRNAKSSDASLRDTPWPRYLETKMTEWSSRRKSEKLKDLEKGVKEVKDIMRDNMELLIQRQDRIDNVMDKTEQLQADSFVMKNSATTLKKKLWWKNVKLWIILGVVVLLVVVGVGIGVWRAVA